MSVDLKFRVPPIFAQVFHDMRGEIDQATAFCQMVQLTAPDHMLDKHGIPHPDRSMFAPDQTLHERKGNTRTVQKIDKSGRIQYRKISNPRPQMVAQCREAQEALGIPCVTPASVRALTHPQ